MVRNRNAPLPESNKMTELVDRLKSLHATLIDSRNGYDEALADAEGKGLTTLFQEMRAIHGKDADDIGRMLLRHGETPDSQGSFMSVVNRTIISVRSLFSDLDEKILPGLIDGEERVIAYYDEAIQSVPSGDPDVSILREQREALLQKIAGMKRQAEIAGA